ncbi:MAG TPA: HAD-IA family hydrolase, partial [Dehalococcoidia bacterium]|nr:HAD-IA family hydrolase [Dehalococcoidia bacterium]
MSIRAVIFDIGETLINETRLWAEWADWLGVSPLTLLALVGAMIGQDRHHVEALRLIKPGFDVEREEAARAAAGIPNNFDQRDLYPDVRSCFEALRVAGYLIGVAGNQPARADGQLRALGLPFDLIGISAAWGVEKPSPKFFSRIVRAAGLPPEEIAYVGDRLDNDILPA